MDNTAITERDQALAREAKERAEEAERQAILQRQATAARETRRLKLFTSVIGATGAIGLIAIYFCAVVSH